MMEPPHGETRLNAFPFTVEDLCARVWRFGPPGQAPLGSHVRLRPGGAIGGLRSEQEVSWRLQGGRVAFLDDADVASVSFDEVRVDAAGRLVLYGETRHASDVSSARVLREVEPLAALRAEAPALDWRMRPGAAGRRNLVVLRAGETSLHPGWPRDIADDERNWDLCTSWYGSPETFGHDALAEHQVLQNRDQDRKWTALHDLFHEGSPLWDYERVFFPDDDLRTSWRDINTLFSICRRFDLDLAQPTIVGYPNQRITTPHPEHLLRYTSWVEVMAPIFSRQALRLCAPTFESSVSGFGLDHVWPKLLGEPRNRIAMIDQVVVEHTRPGNVATASYDYEGALREGSQLQGLYGAPWRTFEFGAIRREPIDRHYIGGDGS